ncbi:MAG TPA: hypothetical protein VFO69_06680 [Allosphingosinicella sp.]|nr:hypothetical protein [Allosphingosinicella sp.]
MRLALPCFTLLLAACGGDREEAVGPAPDTNQIERLATPEVVEEDPLASARLQPLTPEDVAEAGLSADGCVFRSGASLLVVTGGSDSIARIGGRLVHLVQTSPVGPSGGFFEDRGLSISIGRTDASAGLDARLASPARATVTNRRTRAQIELPGVWSCRS